MTDRIKATPSNLITFTVDDRKFILTRETLSKHSGNFFTQILNKTKQDATVVYDDLHNMLYIDRDPRSFAYIVDYLRGYFIYEESKLDGITDMDLREKVKYDFKYFGLDNSQNSNQNLDDVAEILKSTDESYNDKEAPFMKRFLDMLKSTSTSLSTSINKTNDNNSEINSEFNSDILKSNDPEKINIFIEQVNGKLHGGNPAEIISTLSNDETIKNMIKAMNQEADDQESDVDSLEFGVTENENEKQDEDKTTDKTTDELVTDIANKKIDTDSMQSTQTTDRNRVKIRYIPIN